ncbi:hypothetical protein [Levilactobacillus zymae]|uniref:hypothetical protein n=1 Tax=Levilactobacillus zymae TaxID=267363 RepID=UPI000B3FFC29|nr:hypothetical protein [Levilactobacillus zymae]
MKLEHFLIALLVTTMAGGVLVMTPTTTAQAKTQYTLKSIPKKVRGTWYTYHSQYGKHYYTTYKITSKRFSERDFDPNIRKWTMSKSTVHVLKRSAHPKDSKKNDNKLAVYMHGDAVVVQAWSSYNLPYDFRYESKYQIDQKSYHGQPVPSLHHYFKYIDSDPSVGTHFYHTKAQAKYFNPTGKDEGKLVY